MILTTDLINYIDDLLQPHLFSDYAPNGLQVQGNEQISTIVTSVTASLAAIRYAISKQADALLVHHGYFWKGESPILLGLKHARIKSLLAADINLLAYHLPLDAHPALGNNAQIGLRIGLINVHTHPKNNLIFYGELSAMLRIIEFESLVSKQLDTKPLLIAAGKQFIKRIAWCSGGAQSYFQQAMELPIDLYLTGESNESCYHIAQESGIAFMSAGHHATERYGVQALAQYLREPFDLRVYHFEEDNPF